MATVRTTRCFGFYHEEARVASSTTTHLELGAAVGPRGLLVVALQRETSTKENVRKVEGNHTKMVRKSELFTRSTYFSLFPCCVVFWSSLLTTESGGLPTVAGGELDAKGVAATAIVSLCCCVSRARWWTLRNPQMMLRAAAASTNSARLNKGA